MRRRFAAQSAMEYLMTYGWAILAIAIVMVSLYSLGIFNTGSLQPTATPGSCEVVRTAAQTSLAGQCSNLIPKYVGGFSGTSSNITVSHKFFQGNSFTVLTWVYWPSSTNLATGCEAGSYTDCGVAWSAGGGVDKDFGLLSRGDRWYLNFNGDDMACSTGPATGRWYQFGASWNSSTKQRTIWVNGAGACNGTSTGSLVSNNVLLIGVEYSGGGYAAPTNGLIANVQIYNSSLDGSYVKALYHEGIGGAPLNLQHLVGWWPLNGNANDYSGYNNNGNPTGTVTWNANWQSEYSAPST